MRKRQNPAFHRNKKHIHRKRGVTVAKALHLCFRKRDETLQHPKILRKLKKQLSKKTPDYDRGQILKKT